MFLLHHLICFHFWFCLFPFSLSAQVLFRAVSSSTATGQFSLSKLFKPKTPSAVTETRRHWLILLVGPIYQLMVLCRHRVPRPSRYLDISRKGQREKLKSDVMLLIQYNKIIQRTRLIFMNYETWDLSYTVIDTEYQMSLL